MTQDNRAKLECLRGRYLDPEGGDFTRDDLHELAVLLIERVKKLENLLSECRATVASLPENALGVVLYSKDESGHPIKSELLHYIDKALEKSVRGE